MRVRRFSTTAELRSVTADWNRLARGVPFRRSEWLLAWWQGYGAGDSDADLFVLACLPEADDESRADVSSSAVALWPLYRTRRPLGWVLRPLGGDEVCSDYAGILCEPGREDEAGRALAEFLTAQRRSKAGGWDLLDLDAQDDGDGALGATLAALTSLGHRIQRRPGPRWWRIELPSDWPAYLRQVSPSHRWQLRRVERRAEQHGITLHVATDEASRARAFRILVELHALRRQQAGDEGAFTSPRFLAFHDRVTAQLLPEGAVWLAYLCKDGIPVAAIYALVGGGVHYAYQSGIDPRFLDEEPGRLMLVRLLQAALDAGARAVDLLRGDQPYKAHFRALPRPSSDVLVAHRHLGARLRFALRVQGQRARSQLRGWLGLRRGWDGGYRAQ